MSPVPFVPGGETYVVKVKGIDVAAHYVGWQWEAKIVEMFSTFEINGVRGRGLSEFHYHNSTGRPAAAAVDDPEWFAAVVEKAYRHPAPDSLRNRGRARYYDWQGPCVDGARD